MRALVTGANGFLGRHTVGALLARGHQVRALVRPAARLEELAWPSAVEVVRADLRSARDLEAAFADVDVLVHLAASVSGGDDAMFSSTVVGTERLLAAMARTRCRRLVLASSFSVYDWSKINGTLDESSPVEPAPDLYERDGYAIAKSWQERVTRRFAEQHRWDLIVLRPGFIWGRGHGFFAAMGHQMGSLYLVVSPLAHVPMTHVENCADLFALAAEDQRATGHTFNVVDGPGERIWSFLGRYLRGVGERAFRVPIPYHFARPVIGIAFATLFKRNLKLPHVLIPCRFEARLKPLKYNHRKASDLLGWRPPLALEECLRKTFGASPGAGGGG